MTWSPEKRSERGGRRTTRRVRPVRDVSAVAGPSPPIRHRSNQSRTIINAERRRRRRSGRGADAGAATSSVSLECTAMNVRPLHDRIIVQRLEQESEQRAGAIIIPDSAKEKPQHGKVLAAGLGKSDKD